MGSLRVGMLSGQKKDESTNSNHGEAWNRKRSQPWPERVHGLWAAARNPHLARSGCEDHDRDDAVVFRATSASCG